THNSTAPISTSGRGAGWSVWSCVLPSVEFGNQFLGRRQTIGAHQDRFDFRPVDLSRIEPQPYPAEMTNVLWDVKSARGVFRQLLGDASWALQLMARRPSPRLIPI